MRRQLHRGGRPVILAVSVLLLLAPSAGAAEYLTEPTVLIDSGETVSGDLYAAGWTVVVNGRVLGDVVAAAQSVVINGEVTGSVNVIGQALTVDGEVGGAVRAAASDVAIAGTVERDVVVLGGSVVIAESGRVNGDLGGAMGSLDVDGTVDGDINAGADRISIDGTVAGDVSVEVGALRIGPEAVVEGDVRYTSGSAAEQSPVVEIGGVVQRTEPLAGGALLPDHPVVQFAGLMLGLLVAGFLVMLVRPIPAIAVGETLRLRPFAALGVGLASWIGQFLALVLLLVLAVLLGHVAGAFAGAVLGVAVVLVLLLVLVALLTQVVVTLGVARVLASVAPRGVPSSPWLAYAVAAILVAATVTVAGLHPVSASLVALLIWVVGLGTVVLYQARRRFVETHPLPPAVPQPVRRSVPHASRQVATGPAAATVARAEAPAGSQTASGSRYSP